MSRRVHCGPFLIVTGEACIVTVMTVMWQIFSAVAGVTEKFYLLSDPIDREINLHIGTVEQHTEVFNRRSHSDGTIPTISQPHPRGPPFQPNRSDPQCQTPIEGAIDVHPSI